MAVLQKDTPNHILQIKISGTEQLAWVPYDFKPLAYKDQEFLQRLQNAC
jgi:hypothetical protein